MALQPLSQESYRCSGRDIIGSVFVKFYRDYETKNSENSTFVGAPERLYKAIVDFAEANEINLNSRQFPKAHNIVVKKLKAIKPNLKAGFGIIVDIERDSSNNSIITIYRNKTKSYDLELLRNKGPAKAPTEYYSIIILLLLN
jgi:hypothetical protein